MTIELLSHNLRKRKLNSVGQRTRSPDSHQMEKKKLQADQNLESAIGRTPNCNWFEASHSFWNIDVEQ
jgi:hypothetical protein